MRYLLETASTNVDENTLPLASVDLDDEAIRAIAARRKLFIDAKDRDDEISEMSFWDWRVDFYDEDADFDPNVTAVMSAAPSDAKYLALSDEDELPPIAATEGEHMRVREDGVAWCAFPKNGPELVTTSVIPYEVLFKGQL